ncbi:papain fold toxin domain-containing protein [uncultured Vagococcus sp.]|uniref:papain fold toxin domain-containing protein n=1 Tax=uncultured Vagococcus sp. TaxID=189676 RepID=UPI0028D39F5E|nr:papain fold toxin domain-containing protein [uncultured Vagococcus sp.]
MNGHGWDPSLNKPSSASIKKLIDTIPDKYKKNGQCDKFADSLEKLLKENGVDYKRLKVKSEFGIYSDKAGEMIGNNGFHDAIKIGDKVYDNLTLDGMNFKEWKLDLGIDIIAGIGGIKGESVMQYQNIEEIIANIKLRPKMYIEEISIKNLYFFLVGYIGCGGLANISTKLDREFKRNFSKWTENWFYLNVGIDFTDDCLSWYKMYQKASLTEEEGLELFFESSQAFFTDYHKNKLEK